MGYIHYAVLIFVGSAVLWVIWRLVFTKPQAQWSEAAMTVGIMRKNHWKYEDTQTTLVAFFPWIGELKNFPLKPDVPAMHLIKHREWKATFAGKNTTSNLVFSFQFPQLADGREVNFSEMYFVNTDYVTSGLQSFCANWVCASDLEVANLLLGSDFLQELTTVSEVLGIHLVADRLTFVGVSPNLDANLLEVLSAWEKQSFMLSKLVPNSFWQ